MKILIIRVSAIGDVIHTLPAVFLLKRCLPEAKISWIIQQKSAALIHNQPFLENTWVVSNRFLAPHNIPASYKILKNAYATQWDAIIDFQGLLKTSMLILPFKGKKYGFDWHHAREKLSSLFTHKHTMPSYRNIIQKNLALASDVIYDLAKTVHCPTIESLQKDFYLQFSEIQQEAVVQWLKENAIKKFIVLCPNTTWKSKLWPLEYWYELTKKLTLYARNHSIVLVGKDFGPIASKLAQMFTYEKIPVHVVPRWDLLTTTYLIKQAALLIAPDTSFLHIADFLGIQSIGIFGPTLKEKHGPFLYTPNIMNAVQIDCPHHYEKNHTGKNCMQQLTADHIFKKIQNILF